jgi:hypothetical protein
MGNAIHHLSETTATTSNSDPSIHHDPHQRRALQTTTTMVGQVDRFILINADTDLPIVDLFNDTIINIATQATSNFNIQVTIVPNSGTVGSIKFGYNTKSSFRIERDAPYAFCGDGSPTGNFYPCSNLNTANGQPHIVTATPYSGSRANGTLGLKKTVSFQIVNIPPTHTPTMSPTPKPTSAPTTKVPTSIPTKIPTSIPTKIPTSAPTKIPTSVPTMTPSNAPISICNIPQVSAITIRSVTTDLERLVFSS